MYQLSSRDNARLVRIHSRIARFPWARLLYVGRAIDVDGCGWVELNWDSLLEFLNAKASTVWEWLRRGKTDGAFRHYHKQGCTLRIFMGSKRNICTAKNLDNWGDVIECYLGEIAKHCRRLATVASVQGCQRRSRQAAIRDLDKVAKDRIPPKTDQIFRENGSTHAQRIYSGQRLNAPCGSRHKHRGEAKGLLWEDEKILYVTAKFTTFGASQSTIAEEIDISSRSVRRHIGILGIPHRQICQTKRSYKLVAQSLKYIDDETIEFYDSNNSAQPYKRAVNRGQIFEFAGKVFIKGCNIYAELFDSPPERFQRVRFAKRNPPAVGGEAIELELVAESQMHRPPAIEATVGGELPAIDPATGKLLALFFQMSGGDAIGTGGEPEPAIGQRPAEPSPAIGTGGEPEPAIGTGGEPEPAIDHHYSWEAVERQELMRGEQFLEEIDPRPAYLKERARWRADHEARLFDKRTRSAKSRQPRPRPDFDREGIDSEGKSCLKDDPSAREPASDTSRFESK